MRESAIEKAVTAHAKKNGWISFKWVSPSQRGVPDRLTSRRRGHGRVQGAGKKPAPYQLAIHRQLASGPLCTHHRRRDRGRPAVLNETNLHPYQRPSVHPPEPQGCTLDRHGPGQDGDHPHRSGRSSANGKVRQALVITPLRGATPGHQRSVSGAPARTGDHRCCWLAQG